MLKASFPLRLSLALAWMLLVTVLFFLPGAALPSKSWMQKIAFDKWVHTGIFTGLVFLWSWTFNLLFVRSWAALLLLAAVYGLAVEVVQDQFIAYRSFDWSDLLADIGGSFLGLMFWQQYIRRGIKK